MPDRWMEERERRMRDRSWRNEAYGRGGDEPRQGRPWQEDRSFDEERGGFGGYEGQPDRDRVFGERDTGAEYNSQNVRPGGGGYGAGAYGGGQSYGRGAGGGPDYRQGFGGRDQGRQGYGGRNEEFRSGGFSGGRQPDYRSGGFGGRAGRQDQRPDWQDRDYGGVSPAMEHGEYEAEHDRGQRFQSQDYTRGGRFYGDDRRQPIYREEYGQGGREYGAVPRGFDADRDFRREEGLYGNRDLERRYAPEMRQRSSGGNGGYDFERGYGDAGRTEHRSGGPEFDRDRHDDRGGGMGGRGGAFFQRVTSWVGNAVDEVKRDLSGERGQHERGPHHRDDDRDRPQRYAADFGREARWQDPGHRGRGPKGYQRPDERINDEAHQRLTDDPWLDASNIDVKVSGGEVTLTGFVENREAKRRAEQCVEGVSGVSHVQNDLRIGPSNPLTGSGRGFGDSVLEAQMKQDGQTGGGASNGDDSASTRSTTRRS